MASFKNARRATSAAGRRSSGPGRTPQNPIEPSGSSRQTTGRFIDRSDPVLRAFDAGVDHGARDGSPGECPFRDDPLRDAWIRGCVLGRSGLRPKHSPILRGLDSGERSGPSVRSAALVVCSVCGQLASEMEQIDEAREIELFGAARYAWCPACRRKVDRPWSASYMSKWNRFIRSHR
jgi:hypothetical protein